MWTPFNFTKVLKIHIVWVKMWRTQFNDQPTTSVHCIFIKSKMKFTLNREKKWLELSFLIGVPVTVTVRLLHLPPCIFTLYNGAFNISRTVSINYDINNTILNNTMKEVNICVSSHMNVCKLAGNRKTEWMNW